MKEANRKASYWQPIQHVAQGYLKGYAEAEKKAGVLVEALKEILESRGNTLLGRCCVENRCVRSDSGASCELQEKVNSAFSQMAGIAGEALQKYANKDVGECVKKCPKCGSTALEVNHKTDRLYCDSCELEEGD